MDYVEKFVKGVNILNQYVDEDSLIETTEEVFAFTIAAEVSDEDYVKLQVLNWRPEGCLFGYTWYFDTEG